MAIETPIDRMNRDSVWLLSPPHGMRRDRGRVSISTREARVTATQVMRTRHGRERSQPSGI